MWNFCRSLRQGKKKIDWVLLAYFALWYLGNYYYNITNKCGALHDSSEMLCSMSAFQAGLFPE